jgi:hypothetical protein
MTIKTATGATIAIGTVLAVPNNTLAEYQADSYTAIGDVESVGEFGDAREIVAFASLSDGRRQKARGIADAGDVPVVYADKTGDNGQLAMEAAFAATSQATDEFNFRVTLNDQISSNPTRYYFRARVPQLRVQPLANDAVVKIQAVLAINTAVVKQAAT